MKTSMAIWMKSSFAALALAGVLAGAQMTPELGLIERVSGDKAAHVALPASSGAAPERGAIVYNLDATTQPLTACPIRRVSDVGDIPAGVLNSGYPYDGQPGRGLHNGYSKYACENLSGEYVLAFGVQPWVLMLYKVDGTLVRRVMHKWSTGSEGLGETFDVRWDLSGRPGTQDDFYFVSGSSLIRQNAATAAETKVWSLPAPYKYLHEGHMGQGANGLRMVKGWDQKTSWSLHLVNVYSGTATELTRAATVKGLTDVSPSGKWVLMQDAGWTVPLRLHPGAALAAGDTSQGVAVPTTSFGHDGWAWDADGNELFCFMDNKTDWYCALDPASGALTQILNMAELGWSVNYHLTVMPDTVRGWIIMFTYAAPGSMDWGRNQIIGLEIAPATQRPRVWRLGSTNNWWGLPKESYYFAEAFGSVAPSGERLWWGANWNNQDNLELYRLDLPRRWWETLGAGGAAIATATATAGATATVIPTPGATAMATATAAGGAESGEMEIVIPEQVLRVRVVKP